jgi:hypothetical protein
MTSGDHMFTCICNVKWKFKQIHPLIHVHEEK